MRDFLRLRLAVLRFISCLATDSAVVWDVQSYELEKPLFLIKHRAQVFCYGNRTWIKRASKLIKPSKSHKMLGVFLGKLKCRD